MDFTDNYFPFCCDNFDSHYCQACNENHCPYCNESTCPDCGGLLVEASFPTPLPDDDGLRGVTP